MDRMTEEQLLHSFWVLHGLVAENVEKLDRWDVRQREMIGDFDTGRNVKGFLAEGFPATSIAAFWDNVRSGMTGGNMPLYLHEIVRESDELVRESDGVVNPVDLLLRWRAAAKAVWPTTKPGSAGELICDLAEWTQGLDACDMKSATLFEEAHLRATHYNREWQNSGAEVVKYMMKSLHKAGSV